MCARVSEETLVMNEYIGGVEKEWGDKLYIFIV